MGVLEARVRFIILSSSSVNPFPTIFYSHVDTFLFTGFYIISSASSSDSYFSDSSVIDFSD